MVTMRRSVPRGALGWLRSHGGEIALEAIANLAGPIAVYRLVSPHLGPLGGLIAAAAPPTLWSVIGFVRSRRLDAISLVVLGGIVLSVVFLFGGGGVRMLQLRESLIAGVMGLGFLGSAALGRPLILLLARAGARRQSQAAAQTVAAVDRDPRFRRAMTSATLIWGVGLLTTCAVSVAAVYTLSIESVLVVLPLVNYGTLGLLTAWTFWFVPRALRAALARDASGPT